MTPILQLSAVRVGVSLFLFSGLSVAQTPAATHTPTYLLDEVTITASPMVPSGLVVPAHQLSGAALTQRQGSTLGETLDNLPGVANSSFGPNVGRPSIRGMDSDRIAILQNSGASMDVSGLSSDHAVPLDPLSSERIEVLRGPAALLYGGSAMGGVINVMDNRIAREPLFSPQGGVQGRAELRAGGAADERSSAAMVEAGNDRVVLHVDAFDRTTQNLRVPRGMRCGEGGVSSGRRVCNSASDSQGGALGATLQFDKGYVGLSGSDYRSTYGTVAEPEVSIAMQRRHQAMEGLWRVDLPVFESLKLQLGQTRYSHTEFDAAVAGTRFENGGTDLRFEAQQQTIPLSASWQWQGMVGLQGERNRLQATGDERFLPASHTQSMGLFTYQALKTTWGQLSAGARLESVTIKSLESIGPNGDTPAQEKNFSPHSVALGVLRSWRQTDGASRGVPEGESGWQLSSNWSASQRAPKDYELFAHGVHLATAAYEIGRPSNALEKGNQLDLGAAWQHGPHQFSVTGFRADFANYLALQPTGQSWDAQAGQIVANTADTPVYTYQGVRARFQGVEASGKTRLVGGSQAHLSPNAAHGMLDLELRADAVHAQDLSHNSPLPRIAPLRLGADVLWSHQGLGARLGLSHAGAQTRVPEGGVATSAYTLWNAALNYRVHSGPARWLLFAKLDNLTNQLAYSATSVLTQTLGANAPPLAGRSLKLGVQARF